MEKKSVMTGFKFINLSSLLLVCLILLQCAPSKKLYDEAAPKQEQVSKSAEVVRTLPLRTTDSLKYLIEHNPILKNHFVGFVLHDPIEGKDVLSINGSRPFTPASNMKLYTLYTSLNYLDDRVNALEYYETNDSLIIRGTGDPSFLDPYQKDNNYVFDFLSKSDKKIYVDLYNFEDGRFGAGWAWDDYPYYYQAEKSGFPLYANKFYIRKEKQDSIIHIEPKIFEQFITEINDTINPGIVRAQHDNSLTINNLRLRKLPVSWDMPISNSPELLAQLLSDTLTKEVEILNQPYRTNRFKSVLGIAIDSLLQELMIVSDNFIAEQLLLMCSQKQFGYMKTSELIKFAKKDLFDEMPDTIKWVDGSGLSRYNLVTPNTNVWILNKLLEKWDFEKIKTYFPSGKGNDTLDESFQYDKPWIFAKTGSLSNNFNLSGYLITRSNKKLLFSFMNNHYMDSRSEVIKEMNEILSFVRDNY